MMACDEHLKDTRCITSNMGDQRPLPTIQLLSWRPTIRSPSDHPRQLSALYPPRINPITLHGIISIFRACATCKISLASAPRLLDPSDGYSEVHPAYDRHSPPACEPTELHCWRSASVFREAVSCRRWTEARLSVFVASSWRLWCRGPAKVLASCRRSSGLPCA